MSSRLNKKRLLRGRTVGFTLIAIMAFLVFGFVFIADEPLTVQVTEEFDLQICPPYCDEAYFEIPIPEFEVRTIEVTPIITTIDDLGNSVTNRGETTFLQQITGFSVTIAGDLEKTFDNGKLIIELELLTDLLSDESISVLGSLESLETSEFGGNTGTIAFTDSGITREGIFVAEILNVRIDQLVPQAKGTYHYDMVITDITVDFDDIKFSNEQPFVIYSVDFVNADPQLFEILPFPIDNGFEFPDPIGIDPCESLDFVIANPDVCSDFLLPDQILPFCDPEILDSTGICAFEGGGLPITGIPCTDCDIIIIQEDIPPIPDDAIVEEVVEDVPNTPCFETKFDSISYLSPTVEVSGTTSFFTTTPEGLDQTVIDVRNNRNCDLDVALGSKWVSNTGEIFISDLEDITIPTNATIPFKSILFDSTTACAGFACSGQKVTSCFFGQVSTTDPIEIIDESCGNKFFR